MKLTEAEGKELLKKAGLLVPRSILITKAEWQNSLIAQQQNLPDIPLSTLQYPVFVKAQVLHGNRALQGLVKKADDEHQLLGIISQMFETRDQFNQEITQVLVEELIELESVHYLSLGYDTRSRSLIARYSSDGGEGMDDRAHSLGTRQVAIGKSPTEFSLNPELLPVIQNLWTVFVENDATLVEINPLAKASDGQWYCLDAKIELDEVASFRHPEWQMYPERSGLGRQPTERETMAHEVSRSDHRGVAGESFFEFEGGEIGVMASGGGASQLAMDALMAEGLKPANYTEYSGNPAPEKVKKLADVVLSIPNLKGLYVVGSNANFTDIYETLVGVIDGLLESQYKDGNGFAVLIRRGGPRWQEAFEMVEERLGGKGFKLKLFGPEFPLVDTAHEMRKLMNE